MAHRLNFNKINRKVHFVASMIIVIFALFYSATGLIMSKFKWFPAHNITTTVNRYALNYQPDTTNLANFGNEIKQQYSISGRMDYYRNKNNSITFLINRPGINYEILVQPKLDSVVIKSIENHTVHEVSKRLHRMHAFKGGWVYVVWGIMYDITAIAFMLFAITGLIIWFKYRKVFKWGWIVLVPTLIFTLIMIYYLQ